MNKILPIVVLGAGLASCATVPTPLQGNFAASTPTNTASADGQSVRWGGDIIKVEPKADVTCFEILGRELNASARPIERRSADPSEHRFIACRHGFYDPEVFERGREITVVGHVTGTDRDKVGQFDYAYPHVAADTIYLWPERPLYRASPYYDPWLYGGFGGPWGYGYGYGSYWGPFWGGPTVIIRGGGSHHHH